MKYKIYNDGKEYSLPNDYVINTLKEQRVPVSDGGTFTLKNGTRLTIDEYMAPLDPWGGGDEYEGIGFSVSSGNQIIAYYLIPSNSSLGWYGCESGYNAFWDLPNLYANGNILKIYDCGDYGVYEIGDMYSKENYAENLYGLKCNAVILLEDDYWVLKEEPYYIGQPINTNCGEVVYISGPSWEDSQIGVYFTLEYGENSTAYYYNKDGDLLAESSYGWFAPVTPSEGDELHIYKYSNGNSYEFAQSQGIDLMDEDDLSSILDLTYKLKIVNGYWKLIEDNTEE